jgi:hypothetical protein
MKTDFRQRFPEANEKLSKLVLIEAGRGPERSRKGRI